MRKFLLACLISVSVACVVVPIVTFAAASYPTSVKSFTTKVDNVDDVMAVDINGLQDEVVAIETALGAGKSTSTIQVVNTQTGAYANGNTSLPFDDTIPQNTEGTELMTLAITPKATTNKLKIDVVVNGTCTVAAGMVVALFQDTTAGALAAVTQEETATGYMQTVKFTHYMAAGTTSATTFKVRAGGTGATFYFNGNSSSRQMGGVMASSITITELKA